MSDEHALSASARRGCCLSFALVVRVDFFHPKLYGRIVHSDRPWSESSNTRITSQERVGKIKTVQRCMYSNR